MLIYMYESFQYYEEESSNCSKYLYCGTLISGLIIGFFLGYQSYQIPNNYCNLTNT